MKKFFVFMFLALFVISSYAKDLEFTIPIDQDDFKDLSKELGVALQFNPMSPAEPLGITGFDVAAELVLTDIDDGKKYWKAIFSDKDPYSYIPVPRIHVQKGLPFGIDVGGMYTYVPNTNIRLWGLELKYAILKGNMAMPAIAIRGAFSKLEGVDELDVNTQSLDLMISKGFLMLTPYAGITALRVNTKEHSDLVDLDDEHNTIYRGFVGLQFSPFPLFVINAEASMGTVNQYGIKIGLRF
ncbi:conserved hypothetical protein [Deferribacter desulfuricans SSM1]|uniref:Outer membrane protein beta-barrel domain-containing protein n=1 Tax=Deferribacter desulfuricans (strain DSM 14783 / JCM 11476 / NBRC 101012 / SSM1) TaxID=639282 RepID=D3PAT7_DEFDS|nr:DUF6588 family protein [Deferribacter desulfuricans]BAI79710.1 conserved hypothetical protein [Deferribacter desulfuricans SSM1]